MPWWAWLIVAVVAYAAPWVYMGVVARRQRRERQWRNAMKRSACEAAKGGEL